MNTLMNLVSKQPLVVILGAAVLGLAIAYIRHRNDPNVNMMVYAKYGGGLGLLGAGLVYMLRSKGSSKQGRQYLPDDVSLSGSEDLMSESFD